MCSIKMKTKKQIGIILILALLALLAYVLRVTVGFSNTVDTIVFALFILLGCWFTYTNYKNKAK